MARGVPAVRPARCVGFVEADVEQAVEAEAGGDQPGLAARGQAGEPVDAGPELVGLDVEVVDGAEQVADDAGGDLVHARVAVGPVRVRDALEQLGLGEFVRSWRGLLGVGRR